MQIDRSQALDPGHGDGGVAEGIDERADDVAGGFLLRVEDHDDRARSASQCSLERIARAEGFDGADDLVNRSLDRDVASGHHHDLRVSRTVRGKAPECCVGRSAARLRDHDDRGGLHGGLLQPRRHRVDRAVERVALDDDVGRPRRGQLEGDPGVDDAPAGRSGLQHGVGVGDVGRGQGDGLASCAGLPAVAAGDR
ncbi:MAG: hypothetical protein U9O18_04210, partial [Chloroflexota bacterium]|nr:hypothetical protein [Chloroflexota bacterium]